MANAPNAVGQRPDRTDGSAVGSQTLGEVVDVDLLLRGDPGGDDCRQQAGGEFHRVTDGVLADGNRDPGVNVRAGFKAGFSECVRQPAAMSGWVPSLANAS